MAHFIPSLFLKSWNSQNRQFTLDFLYKIQLFLFSINKFQDCICDINIWGQNTNLFILVTGSPPLSDFVDVKIFRQEYGERVISFIYPKSDLWVRQNQVIFNFKNAVKAGGGMEGSKRLFTHYNFMLYILCSTFLL